MREAQWDFFYYYFLKVAITLPSFTANQMLETPAQMVSFDAFFSVLETGFVHQILICSPCFCDFCLCSLQFPSSTGIQVPFQDFFFFLHVPLLKRKRWHCTTVPHSQTTRSWMILKNELPAILPFTRAVTPEHPHYLKAMKAESNSHYR